MKEYKHIIAGKIKSPESLFICIYVNANKKIVYINAYRKDYFGDCEELKYSSEGVSYIEIARIRLYFDITYDEQNIPNINVHYTETERKFLGYDGPRSDWDRKPEYEYSYKDINVDFDLIKFKDVQKLYGLIDKNITYSEFLSKSVCFIINKALDRTINIDKVDIYQDNSYYADFSIYDGKPSFYKKIKEFYKNEIIENEGYFDLSIRTEILGEQWELSFLGEDDIIRIIIHNIHNRFNKYPIDSSVYWLLEKVESDRYHIPKSFVGKLNLDHQKKVNDWFVKNEIKNIAFHSDKNTFKTTRYSNLLLKYGTHNDQSIFKVYTLSNIFEYMDLVLKELKDEVDNNDYSNNTIEDDPNKDWSNDDMWDHIQNE